MKRLPVGTLAHPYNNQTIVFDKNWCVVDWLDSACTCVVMSHDIPMTDVGSEEYVYVLTYSGKMGYVLSDALKEIA